MKYIQNENLYCIKSCIEQKRKVMNQNIKEFDISIAYEYAFATKLEKIQSEKVYHIADERMYEMKRQMKKQG